MSVIRCEACQCRVDTDFHETYGPTGETCESCAMDAEEELQKQAAMAAEEQE